MKFLPLQPPLNPFRNCTHVLGGKLLGNSAGLFLQSRKGGKKTKPSNSCPPHPPFPAKQRLFYSRIRPPYVRKYNDRFRIHILHPTAFIFLPGVTYHSDDKNKYHFGISSFKTETALTLWHSGQLTRVLTEC